MFDLNRIKKTIVANLDDVEAPYFLSFWAEEKIGFIIELKKILPGTMGKTPQIKEGKIVK